MFDEKDFLKLKLSGVANFDKSGIIVFYNPKSIIIAIKSHYIIFNIKKRDTGYSVRVGSSMSKLTVTYSNCGIANDDEKCTPFHNNSVIESYPMDDMTFDFESHSFKASSKSVTIKGIEYKRYHLNEGYTSDPHSPVCPFIPIAVCHAEKVSKECRDTFVVRFSNDKFYSVDFSLLFLRFPFMSDYIFNNQPAYNSFFSYRLDLFNSWLSKAGVDLKGVHTFLLLRKCKSSSDSDIILFNTQSNNMIQISALKYDGDFYTKIVNTYNSGFHTYLTTKGYDFPLKFDLNFGLFSNKAEQSFDYSDFSCKLYKLEPNDKIKLKICCKSKSDELFVKFRVDVANIVILDIPMKDWQFSDNRVY